MDFEHLITGEDRAFYEELTVWLDTHLADFRQKHQGRPPLETLKAWHTLMYEGGWIGISWPPEYGGRNVTGTQQVIMDLELTSRRAPRGMGSISVERVGPAVILHGSDEQKAEFLPGILRGDHVWCQGFSEPDAGSDLAALKTRAERVDGGYKVNGQKIWTSNAFFSERMWLLARTDPEAPKHRGISAFIVDMSWPGIEVRPIRQITGERSDRQAFGDQFNEVFFSDLFIPEMYRIGPENQGWAIARSTLVRERATNVTGFLRDLTSTTGALEKLVRDPEIVALYGGETASLEDAVVDARIRLAGLEQIFETAVRAMVTGEQTGGETSVAKLVGSELQQRINEAAMSAAGPYGQVMGDGPGSFKNGRPPLGFIRSRGATIGGGTSEIQRNWIAERLLGLKVK